MSKEWTFTLPSRKRKESLDAAANLYAQTVDPALPYLTSRGIDADIAKQWQLGCVVDPQPGHDRWVGWLSIPYLTPGGVVSLKFRCIQDHNCKAIEYHRKYDSEPGSSSYLFGVNSLERDSTFVCITEGELDCVAANAIALLPAVGVSGTNKWRAHWQYVFEGYDDVIVLKDGDPEGDHLAKSVTSNVHHSRVVSMPDGHDVNSFLLTFGAQALRERAGLDA